MHIEATRALGTEKCQTLQSQYELHQTRSICADCLSRGAADKNIATAALRAGLVSLQLFERSLSAMQPSLVSAKALDTNASHACLHVYGIATVLQCMIARSSLHHDHTVVVIAHSGKCCKCCCHCRTLGSAACMGSRRRPRRSTMM